MALDPYQTLGISPDAPDAEVRKAYRRLVQKYHPDHNNGSYESEVRFEEVQEAYAKVRELRAAGIMGAGPSRASRSSQQQRQQPRPQPAPSFDPDIEARAAAL